MVDLYLITTPLFILLLLLSLVSLKFVIRAINRSQKLQKQCNLDALLQGKIQYGQTDHMRSQCQLIVFIIKVLCKNHTLLELFCTNNSKTKITFLLSIAAISIFSYHLPNYYFYSMLGAMLTLLVILIELLLYSLKVLQAAQSLALEQHETNYSKLYLIIGVVTSASYLYLCGITFKNYHNNLLQDLLIGIGVNVAVEHAIVRPTLWVIIAILFSFSERACSYFEDIERQTAQQCAKIANEVSLQIRNELLNDEIIQRQKRQKRNVKLPPLVHTKSLSNTFSMCEGNSCEQILIHENPFQQTMKELQETVKQETVKQETVKQELAEKCQTVLKQQEIKEEIEDYNKINLQKALEESALQVEEAKYCSILGQANQVSSNIFDEQNNVSDLPFNTLEPTAIFQQYDRMYEINEDNSINFHKSFYSIEHCRSSGKKVRMKKVSGIVFTDNVIDQQLIYKVNEQQGQMQADNVETVQKKNYGQSKALRISEQGSPNEDADLQEIDFNCVHLRKDGTPRQEFPYKERKYRRRQLRIVDNPVLLDEIPQDNKTINISAIQLEGLQKRSSRLDLVRRRHKKRPTRGDPIVHENDENKPQFFVTHL